MLLTTPGTDLRLRLKIRLRAAGLLLGGCLLCIVSPLAMAQTRETLEYVGTSRLDSKASIGIIYDDLRITPHPENDAELAGTRSGPLGAHIPFVATASAQQIRAAQSGIATGFAGLTHRDQRLAGTGVFANTQFSTEPPDQGLAVGNGFVLQTVNAALAIYDQSGTLRQGPTALNQFLHLKPEVNRFTGAYGDLTSDPRAYYDAQLQRWFITVAAVSADAKTGQFAAPTRILIAVSQSNDPTADWKIYSIDTTNDGREGCPCFADQPLIGADMYGFFISTNAFSLRQGFAGAQIYAISKQMLASGGAPAVAHWNSPRLAGGLAFSIQPSFARLASAEGEPSGGVEYMMSTADIRNALDDRIAVWAMSNTASLNDASPAPKLHSVIVKTESFAMPPDAQQESGDTELGSLAGEKPQRIATNDHRLQQTFFAGGTLWSALTTMVALAKDPNPHAGIAYFAIKPILGATGTLKAEVVRQGYVAVPGNDLLFPAIAARENGNAVVAFTVAGADYFPSAAFSLIGEKGAGEVQIVAPGAAAQDGFSGYTYFGGSGSGRSGDYSAATVDADGAIWSAVEFIPSGARTLLANWGTYIAKIAAGY